MFPGVFRDEENSKRMTVRSSTSATFVLPVHHGTGVALYTERGLDFSEILNRQEAH